MYPRAIAKRKICKIGRACGLGCVPKTHNCKVALRGQAKTAVEWLAHVTANPNYEAENNAKIDARLKRFNNRVTTYYQHSLKKDVQKAIEDRKNNPDSVTAENSDHTIYLWEDGRQSSLSYNQLVSKLGKRAANEYLKKLFTTTLKTTQNSAKYHQEYLASKHPYNQQNTPEDEEIQRKAEQKRLDAKQKKILNREKKEIEKQRQKSREFVQNMIKKGQDFVSAELGMSLDESLDKLKHHEDAYYKLLDDKRNKLRRGLKQITSKGLDESENQRMAQELEDKLQKKVNVAKSLYLMSQEDFTQKMKSLRSRLLSDSAVGVQESRIMARNIVLDTSIDNSGHDPKQVRDHVAEFFQLSNGRGSHFLQKIKKTEWRAYASKLDQSINIGGYYDPPTTKRILFHEMGHHIEYESKEILDGAKEWIRSRATSETPVPLSELIPRTHYNENEIAYPDKFLSPYVGKHYGNATEVISVGMERFSNPNDMADFSRKDIEHFYLILGILRSE